MYMPLNVLRFVIQLVCKSNTQVEYFYRLLTTETFNYFM